MKILIPGSDIAARWNGALELRLRRAPLERFLRSRSLPFAATGPAQVTDNVATATLEVVSSGVQLCDIGAHRSLGDRQLEGVALIACVISDQLCTLIQEPQAWRIAALISGAALLKTHVALEEAAQLSATAVRTYEARTTQEVSCSEIGEYSARAVAENDDSSYRAACSAIAQSLNAGEYAAGRSRPLGQSTISPALSSTRRLRGFCRPHELR